MNSSVSEIKELYTYHFPSSEQGFEEGCKQLKEALVETKSLQRVKICLIFDSIGKPEKIISVTLKRKFLNELSLNGLTKVQSEVIMDVFSQLNISINQVISQQCPVIQTPRGGQITCGNRNTVTGVRADLSSLRRMFPGMSDEQIQQLFNNK